MELLLLEIDEVKCEDIEEEWYLKPVCRLCFENLQLGGGHGRRERELLIGGVHLREGGDNK